MTDRIDDLDPLPYAAEMPSLMSAWGRVDIHTIIAKFLSDNKISGQYLEFGVGKGRSAVSAIRAYSRANVCHRFVFFDSFCGLPPLIGADEKSEQFKEGDYAFSRKAVEEFLSRHQISIDDSIQFNEGWIEQTFSQWITTSSATPASVVHIDVDLHSSCTSVLKQLEPVLQNGTVILFDDWNCFKASSKHGERRAVAEWLKSTPDLHLHPFCAYGWHGQTFIVEIMEGNA